MGDNLPPGVTVSDLPGSREPPKCTHCDTIIEGSGAPRGLPLCEEHATEENIERELDKLRRQSPHECQVCHKDLLSSELSNTNPELCETHTVEDYQQMLEHEKEIREEAMERDRKQS